jgi:hypothetical protein
MSVVDRVRHKAVCLVLYDMWIRPIVLLARTYNKFANC